MSNKKAMIPESYKDYIYRLTYHLLAFIAPYIPRSIAPNQITVASFISALIACLFLYFVRSPAGYLFWAIFNFIWYILDALDGAHARLTGQSSEFGGFLDHFLDNVYFIFMFTVFVIRFDLLHPLYIFILLLRMSASTTVFLVQVHTGRLHLGRLSGGFELFLMTTVMILSYCFPYFNLSHYTNNPTIFYLIDLLNLHQGVFMKFILFIYAIGVPINFILQLNDVKNFNSHSNMTNKQFAHDLSISK